MVLSGVSILLTTLFLLVLLDHIGSRFVRFQVQKRARHLFSRALQQKNDENTSELDTPYTIRMKIKGARRVGDRWIPVEAKAFLAPRLATGIVYADETWAPFVSRKWTANLKMGRPVEIKSRLLSIIPYARAGSPFLQLHCSDLWNPWFKFVPEPSSSSATQMTNQEDDKIGMEWSKEKRIDGWDIPTELEILRVEGSREIPVGRYTLTEWAANEDFNWW